MPALPYVKSYYNITTTEVQLTITGSMIGLGIGQLFIGPISDKYGRKNPLLLTLIFYILSSMLIVFSSDIYEVSILRFIQGFSAAGSVVISRAIAADSYSGKKLNNFFGLVMIFSGIGPIISPIIGSFATQYYNWQAVFYILTFIGVLSFLLVLKYKETHTREKRISMSIFKTYSGLFDIVKNKYFMLVVLIQSLVMAILFTYISSSPFLLQIEYNLSVFIYSLIFSLNGFAIVLGTFLSIRLGTKLSLKFGINIIFINSIFLFLILFFNLEVIFLIIVLFLILLGIGMIFPPVSTIAMSISKEKAGSASAILGFLPFLSGGLVSPLVGIGNIYYSTSLIIFTCSLLSLIVYFKIRRNL